MKKKKKRKIKVDIFATGYHTDERMNLSLADIKRIYHDCCTTPTRIELVNASVKHTKDPEGSL